MKNDIPSFFLTFQMFLMKKRSTYYSPLVLYVNKSIFLLLFLFLTFDNQAQEKNIESIISDISGLTYEKTNEANNYDTYILYVKQPIDHFDTTKGFFRQKVYLSHKGFDKPTVFVTAGYGVYRNYKTELSELLEANQILVEHRYFGESMPDTLDYHFLNLKQATADLHRIRLLFSSLYLNKWLSTGISKGGATTIFYRYFYPNDIDVCVPYVAPINKSYEEERIYNFLDTIGTDECRNKIKNFQIRILENREEIIPLLKFYSIGAKIKYSFLSLNEAFEYAVLEYPFSFWQWGHHCSKIPADTSTIEEITEYFISVSSPSFFGDNSIRQLSSHYYQSATEMGYYGYETSEFKEYLIELPTDTNPMALFYPFEMIDKFDGQLLKDVNLWLKTSGDKFIYIYGGNDTWTASAVPYNEDVDSEWFILKGKHHGNARIKSMTSEEQEKFIATLEKWLSIKISSIKN